jgi:hypothetical protein
MSTLVLNPPSDTTALQVSSYAVTLNGSAPMIDLSGNWNTSGGPTAIRLNITNTQSFAPLARLVDLQVGGVTKWNVDAFGNVIQQGTLSVGGAIGLALGSATVPALFWNGAPVAGFYKTLLSASEPCINLLGAFAQSGGKVGFFGKAPIAQPVLGGAQIAGSTYGPTEQAMLQAVYDALRALGLGT